MSSERSKRTLNEALMNEETERANLNSKTPMAISLTLSITSDPISYDVD
jgi:hypothetical protein